MLLWSPVLIRQPPVMVASGSSVCGISLSNSYGVKTNLIVDDVEEVISELRLFKEAGGGTVCDISPVGVRSVLFDCFMHQYQHSCYMYVRSEMNTIIGSDLIMVAEKDTATAATF